jgi:hypothetical protein
MQLFPWYGKQKLRKLNNKDGGSDGGLENKPIQAKPWRLLVPDRRCFNAAINRYVSVDRPMGMDTTATATAT